MLTSRERVLCALNHEEPDRVPIFFGTSGATTMLAPAYERLKAHLGIAARPTIFWRGLQYVLMDEEVLAWSGSDGRPLMPGAAPAPLAHDVSADAYVDGWGSLWERRPGAIYYEVVDSPIRGAPPSTTSTVIPGPTWRIPAGSPGCASRPRRSRTRATPWWC